MNTTQRPNFVLVCIAVVLLSFSFAGEMLCSSIQETATLEPLANDDLAIPQQSKSSVYQGSMSSQVYSTERFTPNVLSKNVARHETTGELSTVPTAELGYDGELIVIDNIQELKAEAAEASSKSESVTHNHQVSDDISYVVNNIIRTSIKSTKSVDPRPQRSIAKRSFIKPKVVAIAVSVNQPGYSTLLPSYSFNEQAQLKLKQALEEFNLGNRAKDKLKLVLLKGGHQDLIELKQEGPNPSAADTIMTFLKELTGYSAEEKIYVLKNLSEKRIKELKKILNAHNITLRAFIRA